MKKQVLLLFLMATMLAAPVFGQAEGIGVPSASIAEPQNHAIVVDNLMRYHDSGEYEREIREIANAARDYLAKRYPERVLPESRIAAVFDIDETSLSNWDVMAGCGFCNYSTELQLYKDNKYSNAHDPAISPVLELFNFAKAKGIAVFFVTGRPEGERQITVDNLREVGYAGWAELMMQPDTKPGAKKRPAREFKPEARQEIERKGYRIVLNIGDQASDLAGCCAERVFKIPNPFYLVP